MHLRPDMSRPAKLCADTRQVGVSPLCLGGPFGSEIEPPAIWQREIDGDPRCERSRSLDARMRDRCQRNAELINVEEIAADD